MHFYHDIIKFGLPILLIITLIPDLSCKADTVVRIMGVKKKEAKPQIDEEPTQLSTSSASMPKKKIRIIGDKASADKVIVQEQPLVSAPESSPVPETAAGSKVKPQELTVETSDKVKAPVKPPSQPRLLDGETPHHPAPIASTAPASETRALLEKPSAAELLYSTAPTIKSVPSHVATIPESRLAVDETPVSPTAKASKAPAPVVQTPQKKPSAAEILYSAKPAVQSVPTHVATIPQNRLSTVDIPASPLVVRPPPPAPEVLPEPAFWGGLRATPNRSRR